MGAATLTYKKTHMMAQGRDGFKEFQCQLAWSGTTSTTVATGLTYVDLGSVQLHHAGSYASTDRPYVDSVSGGTITLTRVAATTSGMVMNLVCRGY